MVRIQLNETELNIIHDGLSDTLKGCKNSERKVYLNRVRILRIKIENMLNGYK